MRFFWVLATISSFSLAGASLEAVEPRGLSLEKPFDVTVPLSKASGQKMRLRFRAGVLTVSAKQLLQRFPLEDIPEPGVAGSGPSWSVLVDDFNFDGFTDLAIPTGDGYGGVNYFYDLYIYQPAQKRFQRLEVKRDSSGDFLCNPRVEVYTRTIWTDCKSGPKWYASDYRFSDGQPYLWRSGEMMLLDGFSEDTFLYYALEFRSTAAKVTRTAISDTPHAESPIIRYLPVAKTYLYTKPNSTSRTTNYIIRNDAIRILEVRESDAGQWLRIAYRSQKLGRIVRWVNLSL